MEKLTRKGLPAAEPVVGDVTNVDKIRALFERVRPELVFHAAAYKHVPLMEVHASEAVANNVGGTLNVARSASEVGTEKFVNISTDKALNPANVIGATKRLLENIVRSCAAEYPETISTPKYKQINPEGCKLRAKEEPMKPIEIPALVPEQLAAPWRICTVAPASCGSGRVRRWSCWPPSNA